MSEWSASQIRELIEQAIKSERCLRDRLRVEDRERFEEFKRTSAKALELQASEYQRRLDTLNHAHEEARRILGTYLTRELYDRAHSEVVEAQRKYDLRLVEIEARVKSVELGLVNLPGGIKSLELGLASQAGHHTGARVTIGTMIAIGALGASIIAILIGYLAQ